MLAWAYNFRITADMKLPAETSVLEVDCGDGVRYSGAAISETTDRAGALTAGSALLAAPSASDL
jgi:hypothetical protein